LENQFDFALLASVMKLEGATLTNAVSS